MQLRGELQSFLWVVVESDGLRKFITGEDVVCPASNPISRLLWRDLWWAGYGVGSAKLEQMSFDGFHPQPSLLRREKARLRVCCWDARGWLKFDRVATTSFFRRV
jgi:hypothetical protein